MEKKVDLIIYSTKIYTVDSSFSTAQAMAVRDGKIIAIGSNDDIFDNYTAEKVYNGLNKFVYPGFIDGHCHFYWYGENLIRNADLVGTKSFDEVVQKVVEHQQENPAEWILGRGWDQNDWEVKQYPTKEKLDELFPDRPVVLTRIDGHAVLANSEALKRAGITAKTKVEGGDVILGEDGQPTGVLIDNAADKLKEIIPRPNDQQKVKAFREAEKNCFAVGLTSVVDAGHDKDMVLLTDSLHQSGELKMKINQMLSPTKENFEYFIKNGPYITDRLAVRSIKLYADGALGSRGALLLEPYSDDPDNFGLLMKDLDYYREWIRKAIDHGYQVCTHTIGDSGARIMLDLYGEVLEGKNDKRWRIEHAQTIHPDDMKKFGKFSIIPSVQGTHATSDMYWAPDRLGEERMDRAYAFKEMLQQNGWIISGTDFPIENINPLHTFYATVARKDLQGYPENGFLTDNALNREETLKSMTIWAAKGSFEENRKGSLEVGKDADFVILEKDIMEIPIDEVPETRIARTYLDGELVYHDTSFQY
ncbi:MAG: amidohydrolase [Bacteroidales bacterium]|nr:amidohydrolase [Bacteroidales bacterium]MCF8398929.1 amidohydrolase [Bacteroidales bacterium]